MAAPAKSPPASKNNLRELYALRRRQWAAFNAWERTQPPPGAGWSLARRLRWCGELYELARASGAIPARAKIDWEKVRGIAEFRRRTAHLRAKR